MSDSGDKSKKDKQKNEHIVHFYPGEVIFREGQSDDSIYVIKSGEVEISISRDGKSIVLQKLKAGECFGEMAALMHQERSANATASSYTEVYHFTQAKLNQIMEQVPPVIRQLLMAQLKRLVQANNRAAMSATPAHPLLVAAEIIELHAQGKNLEKDGKTYLIKHDGIATTIARVMGLSEFGVENILQKMSQLGFLKLVGKKSERKIELTSLQLIEKAKTMAKDIDYDISGQCPSESELMDMETLMGYTHGSRKTILTRLSSGDFPDKSFVFRRSEIITLLNKHGKDYFTKRIVKNMDEWCEIEDLEFCDTPTFEKAVGRLEPYQLGVLMQGVPHGEIYKRIEHCLSERRREVIKSFADDLGTLTNSDIALVTDELFEKIRAIKAS